MALKQPNVQTLDASVAQQQFASILRRVRRRETRVIVQESGTPVAAIVSADDLRRLELLERERAADFAVIDRVREAFRGVSEEEIERETDRFLADIRAEDAARNP